MSTRRKGQWAGKPRSFGVTEHIGSALHNARRLRTWEQQADDGIWKMNESGNENVQESTGNPASVTPDQPSTIPWPPLLLVSLAAAAWALGQAFPFAWPGQNDIAARVVGLTIGAGGLLLAAWSARTLHHAKTTIRPDRGADNLVTSGPYVRFRNPIYIADIMILLGVAELTKNIWFVVAAGAFGILVTWLAILPEERHLARRFGDAYRDYKSRSRRWL